MDKYGQYFQQALDKFRFVGVGGVQMPNPDSSSLPPIPEKVDPMRQIIYKDGNVMVGGKLVRQKKKGSSIRVLDISSKILDAQKDEAKKDKQNIDTNSK